MSGQARSTQGRTERAPTGQAPTEPASGLTILAAGRDGVVRAAVGPRDAWHVSASSLERRVTCLVTDPLAHNVVYAGMNGADMNCAGTNRAGVQRSSDGGLSWQAAGLTGRQVRSLAVSAHAPGTVYAGTKPAAIFVSRDAGDNWQELTGFQDVRRWFWYSPAEAGDGRAYVQALSVSPTDPDVLVAGMEAGAVVLSEDGGKTWLRHRRHADRDCHTLRFHDSDGDWVYQAGGGGPALSRDGGRSWRHFGLGPHGRYAWACAADPARPEVWYVSAAPLMRLPRFWRMPLAHHDGEANAAIFRLSGGGPWERLTGGLPQPLDHLPYALLTDPLKPGQVYAGLGNGALWHSADHGENWALLPVELGTGLRSLAITRSSP